MWAFPTSRLAAALQSTRGMTRMLWIAALALAACTDNSGISGDWTGTWTSRTGVSGQITAAFSQRDSQIGGTISFTGSPCFDAAQVMEVMAGNSISGTATAGGIQVTLSATWTEPDINGSYDAVSAGACSGDTGTFSLARQN